MRRGRSKAIAAIDEALPMTAMSSLQASIRAGVEVYDRRRMLPRLIGAIPSEIADVSPAGRRAILARLARALRAERNRGRAGHWTYDLNRHIGLMQAYSAERLALGSGGLQPAGTSRPAG